MREQELKLEKVKKSCNTARKVAKGFMIFFIVCAVLCIAGAGVDISEVNRFIKQFEQAQKMMKQLPGMMGRKGKFPKMGGFPFHS